MKVIGIHTKSSNSRAFTLVDNFPPSVVVNGTKFMVHRDPKLIPDPRSATGYSLNCDYLLDLNHDSDDQFPLRHLLGSEYIELKYEDKLSQLVRCHRAKVRDRLDSLEVNLPIIRLESGKRNMYLDAIATDTDFFLVKPTKGASCHRQLVIPAHFFDSLYQQWETIPLNRYSELFPGSLVSSTHQDHHHDGEETLSDDNIVVPFISDVEKEYRLLVGGETVLAYERKLTNKDGYSRVCTASEEPLKADETTLEGLDKTQFFSEQEKADLRKLIVGTGFNYGSYDLYRTRSGKLGVFEYSPNFGFVGIHLAELNVLSMGFFESLFK